eukprot:UN14398
MKIQTTIISKIAENLEKRCYRIRNTTLGVFKRASGPWIHQPSNLT